MCFSANASFTTAAGLSIIGLLSIHAAKKNKQLMPLASCPFFFAIQQSCEGVVWLTLNAGNTTSLLHIVAMYGFVSFAALFWPIWVPFALYLPEKNHRRKKLLLMTLYIGCFSAILLFFSWILQITGAQVINHHIDYPVVDEYPFGITNVWFKNIITWITSLSYCIATMAPFFISSIKKIWMAGIIIMIAFVISYIYYYATLGSVWCFFAAIASGLLYLVIQGNNK
jgi:hypothetical protein